MKKVFAALSLCFFASVVGSQPPSANPIFSPWNEADAEVKFRGLSAYLDNLDRGSIAFLKEEHLMKKNPVQSFHYLKLLGRVGTSRSVPVLCDRLLYRSLHSPLTIESSSDLFLASDALGRMGLSAARGLSETIATRETKADYHEAAFYVLNRICRNKDGVLFLMDRFLEKYDAKTHKIQRERLDVWKKQYLAIN